MKMKSKSYSFLFVLIVSVLLLSQVSEVYSASVIPLKEVNSSEGIPGLISPPPTAPIGEHLEMLSEPVQTPNPSEKETPTKKKKLSKVVYLFNR